MERSRINDKIKSALSWFSYLAFVTLLISGLLASSYIAYEIESERAVEGTNKHVKLEETSAVTNNNTLQYQDVPPSVRRVIGTKIERDLSITDRGPPITLFGHPDESPPEEWSEHDFYLSSSAAYKITQVEAPYHRLSVGAIVYEQNSSDILSILGLYLLLMGGILGIKLGQRLQWDTLITRSFQLVIISTGIGLLFAVPILLSILSYHEVNGGSAMTTGFPIYIGFLMFILYSGRVGKRTASLLGFSAEYAAYKDQFASGADSKMPTGSREGDTVTLDADETERLLTGKTVSESLDDGTSFQIELSGTALTCLSDRNINLDRGDDSDSDHQSDRNG
ncbi:MULTISPECIES: hypothetical protein [Haloarcula]|uniref:hypothetical protein n=1 Tax=Haloarcula TaxID=2237 RepID=UPI0007BBB55F|nr:MULTISPECIES: hypothetical protein [Haloarcula]KZX48274.1 hypothetical protein AV929_20465 [Haloarcula sp. K1]